MSSAGRKRKLSVKKREENDNNSPDEELPATKRVKNCDRRFCQDMYTDPPFCFCKATEKCAGNGYTSRWYHLSAGQHFCNECFEYFYRSNKAGNKLYKQWSNIWDQEAGCGQTPRASQFMADMWLPIWVQCTNEGCGRWRKLPAHIELHHIKLNMVKCSDCSTPEDQVVLMAKDPLWIHTVSYTPLLRYSEVMSSLLKDYFPEGVGISPLTVSHLRKREPANSDMGNGAAGSSSTNDSSDEYDDIHPFNNPKDGPRAGAFTPDVMEDDECKTFPEWTKSPALEVYLIIRNSILSVWYTDCTKCVTVEDCLRVISLRGIVRIWCAQQIPRILHFMSRRGYVNYGLFKEPHPLASLHNSVKRKSTVIVIGAGMAGIGAAKHLANFGYEVTILEGSPRIGGRVHDYTSSGCGLVRMGAMFVTGVVNNPFTYLVKQCNSASASGCHGDDIKLIPINEDKCDLLLERGVAAQADVDKRVEEHFNLTLDKLSEWRNKLTTDKDSPLIEKLQEYHRLLLKEKLITYTKDEENLLNFHYGNLEFACGTTLDNVSARYWDHNDTFEQYSGSHALVSSGLLSLLLKLCPNEKILFNRRVKNIEKKEDNLLYVKCFNGEVYSANQVIVTISLSLLKEESIVFSPELSESKKLAIQRLGAGLVEKIALSFSSPFWRDKLGGKTDLFGCVSADSNRRGLFGVFYDLSAGASDHTPADQYVLMTTISGAALDMYYQLEDQQIVGLCIKTLQALFPDDHVPNEPVGYSLTRWGKYPYAKMSYSYVSVGGKADDYNVMSQEEMDGLLHFAGEATNRQHPQSVTGAYLSGIREAAKIIEHDFFGNMIHRAS